MAFLHGRVLELVPCLVGMAADALFAAGVGGARK